MSQRFVYQMDPLLHQYLKPTTVDGIREAIEIGCEMRRAIVLRDRGGRPVPRHRVTEETIDAIERMARDRAAKKLIARELNVPEMTVRSIITRRGWSAFYESENSTPARSETPIVPISATPALASPAGAARNMRRTTWTPALMSDLEAMWTAGEDAEVVAAELNVKHGVGLTAMAVTARANKITTAAIARQRQAARKARRRANQPEKPVDGEVIRPGDGPERADTTVFAVSVNAAPKTLTTPPNVIDGGVEGHAAKTAAGPMAGVDLRDSARSEGPAGIKPSPSMPSPSTGTPACAAAAQQDANPATPGAAALRQEMAQITGEAPPPISGDAHQWPLAKKSIVANGWRAGGSIEDIANKASQAGFRMTAAHVLAGIAQLGLTRDPHRVRALSKKAAS